MPIAFHVFALCAFAFAAVIRTHVSPVTVGRVFYVWSALFNVFVVSIAAGGTIGTIVTIVGPLLAKALLATLLGAGFRRRIRDTP